MHPWTVYCHGELFDIATDQEGDEYLHLSRTVYVNHHTGVVEIVE